MPPGRQFVGFRVNSIYVRLRYVTYPPNGGALLVLSDGIVSKCARCKRSPRQGIAPLAVLLRTCDVDSVHAP